MEWIFKLLIWEQNRFFVAWGRNPLLLYILHCFLILPFVIPDIPGWSYDVPAWLLATRFIIFLRLLSTTALVCKKKNWILKI